MTPPPPPDPNETLSAGFLFKFLARKWLVLACLAVIGFAGGYFWTRLSPPSYEAKATLLLALPDRAAAGINLISAGGPTPLSIIASVLRSRTAEDRIIEDTKIGRRELQEFLVIDEEPKANSLHIRMTYRPNSKALAVVASAVETLRELDKEIGFSVASRTATSLEQGIAVKEGELKAAEKQLAEFQSNMRTPISFAGNGSGGADAAFSAMATSYNKQLKDLEFQLKSLETELGEARTRAKQSALAASSVATGVPQVQSWRDMLTRKQYDLNIASQRLGPSSPEVVRLKRELDVTQRQLQVEIAKYVESVNTGVAPEIARLEAQEMLLKWQVEYLRPLAKAAPTEAMQLKRLTAEVATLQTVVAQLRAKYETAKLEAAVDQVKWSVLDKPALDDTPSNFRPVRTGGMLAATLTLLGLVVLLAGERRRALRSS